MRRVPIQMIYIPPTNFSVRAIVVLCNDGTMWRAEHASGPWEQLAEVPQPNDEAYR